MNPRTIAIATVSALLAGACATLPTTGTPASGQPLAVDVQLRSAQHVVQEKVGEVQHTDEQGRSLGSSAIYENRVVTEHYTVWRGQQGAVAIDDEDFFRIAGDEQGANEIRDYRETGVLMNRIGLGATAAGIAALLGGYALAGKSGAAGPLLYSGLIVAPVGGLLTYMGLGRVGPDVHPLPFERAQRAADDYNRRLVASDATQLTSR